MTAYQIKGNKVDKCPDFTSEHIFDIEISLTFIFIVTYIDLVKKNHNYIKNSDTYKIFNGCLPIFVIF